ncbi:MAG: hypothetical protein SGPRY_006697 [Prymnesium sp.]
MQERGIQINPSAVAMPSAGRRDPADENADRTRYEALRELRETKPEREAARMVKAMQNTKDASQALIAELRKELEQQSKKQAELSEAVTLAEVLQQENEQMRAELEATRERLAEQASHPTSNALVNFYQMVTGMRVRIEGEKATCSICAASQSEKQAAVYNSISFQLDMAPDGSDKGEIGYLPIDLTKSGHQIPEYLRDEITCAFSCYAPLRRLF